MTKDFKIQSVSEFIQQLFDKINQIKKPTEVFNIWYRAEASTDFKTPLVPKAYRTYGVLNDPDTKSHVYKQTQVLEKGKIASFDRDSTIFFNQKRIQNNSWNKYILMQHYGLGTRLLDWTENALVALYFAVSERELDKFDAKVWLLSPHNLNKVVSKKLTPDNKIEFSSIYFPQEDKRQNLFDKNGLLNLDELFRMYLDLDFVKEHKDFTKNFYPLAIYPYLLDERMTAQRSCFTIFGNEVNGLLDLNNDENQFIESVTIDSSKKRNIEKELRWIGITEQTVYPDSEGICKTIEKKNEF